MIELGKYATEVLSAWGISLGLIAGLVWISLRRDRKIRAELARVEKTHG